MCRMCVPPPRATPRAPQRQPPQGWVCRFRLSCDDRSSMNSNESGPPMNGRPFDRYAKILISEGGAAQRAQRIAPALTLTLVGGRNQRPRRGQRALQCHRTARIAADALAYLVHPAVPFAALLADRGAQRGLDRTPMLQLLGRQAQRTAQARDLAL